MYSLQKQNSTLNKYTIDIYVTGEFFGFNEIEKFEGNEEVFVINENFILYSGILEVKNKDEVIFETEEIDELKQLLNGESIFDMESIQCDEKERFYSEYIKRQHYTGELSIEEEFDINSFNLNGEILGKRDEVSISTTEFYYDNELYDFDIVFGRGCIEEYSKKEIEERFGPLNENE